MSALLTEMRKELYRRDFKLFASQQLTILPKAGAPCRLDLNPLQGRIDEVCERQWKDRGFIRVSVFKARQRGGTTYSTARACWRVYLNTNTSAIIISCDEDSTANAFNKVSVMYEELDPEIKPVRRFLNKAQIVLESDVKAKARGADPGLRSRIECATAKDMNAGVSTTRQVVCMSEMPRWSRTEEIRSSLLPTMPMDGPETIVINEATPFGWGKGREEFRSWCDSARSGKDIYELVELYWHYDPELRIARAKNERIRWTRDEQYWRKACHLDDEQLLWRRRMIAELGKDDEALGTELFLQEFPSDYDSAWVASETPAFDKVKLERLTENTIRPPIRRFAFDLKHIRGTDIHATMVPSTDGQFAIWEEPIPGEIYDIGADCAPPTANPKGDFCAFQIVKRRNKEQVGEYYGHPGIYDYAAMLVTAGTYYNEAMLAVEVNGIGYAVNEQVVLSLYNNIYRWRLRQHASPKYSPLTGWKTQDDTKKLMMAIAYKLFDHGELLIHSKVLKDQFRHYIKYYSDAGNEKYEAGEGKDDGLDAFLIAQTVSRDEDALGQSAAPRRTFSLAEKNKELEQFMRDFQPGVSDAIGPKSAPWNEHHDPWARLAKSFGVKMEDYE